ncbi:serine proteinase stubble [Lasius niger]|uniref:Phenoloxidase-activating factor 2 n=1 Tax=Lasius niger TaxID=67767 RepID=A0A0J7L353_LASNI|nr:serine proteinase stubble [Lasius niger]
MRTQFILIACLAIANQALCTQVYETPSDSSQWQPWKSQDSIQVSNEEQEKYHPVTFDAPDTQQKESQPLVYNANIQSGASGVAEVLNEQSIESIIDNILVSNRQGRNLEGYEEIYSDPEVKNALQLGNDTIARTYIRDKLCSLGLMNCEDTEGRRPYYSPHRDIYPHDVIYAQPVTIKPVGRPLPAIPVKRPYGPAKPVPLPPSFGSPLGPNVYPGLGPTFGRPPSGFVGPYPGPYKKPGFPPPFVSKPIYESGIDIQPDFEDKFIDKKQVVLHQSGSSAVQQHVHHHYHHGDDNINSGIAPNPIPISSSPTLGGNGLGNYGYGNGGTYGATFNDFEDYKKAFKIKTPASNSGPSVSSTKDSYANRYPVYEKPNGKQFGGSAGQYGANNQFPGNGNFDNGDYQFNNGAGDSNYGSTSYEDCVCVPYDQCATINHVGRKDDLYLAIDPRNLDKDIEAESVEVVITDGNGTMSVVRVPKGINETEQIEQARNEQTKEAAETKVTKRNRRDVKHVTKKDDKQEIQERLTVDSNLDTSKLNVRPTWGVSFGLPQTGGPIAPHPGNPLGISGYTPGYGPIGGQGINLGPVSVNPLVAVQVTKDEYGEKVVKPYVNLHVTPNPGLVHKLGHLLAHKKQGLYGGHYGGYDSAVYAPHYHTHHEKPIYHYPSRPPFYPSQGVHHHHGVHYPTYHKPHYQGGHYPSYYEKDDNNDYDDYDYSDDYADDYYRNARARDAKGGQSSSTKDSPKGGQAGSRQTSGKITFSDRRKRDALNETRSERRYGRPSVCGSHHVCCQKSHIIGARPRPGQCGARNTQGINGRIKTPVYVDGDSEFGEYPWQVAILKKDPTESVYVCGGTLISSRHIITAAHCVKTHAGRDLRARLGEWDVNHDVEFYPYIERDIVSVFVHPEFYAGTLANDIAILKLDHDVDFGKNPHISAACLPDKHDDFTGTRCWTTGWGKDAFGDYGKYQNILKEVDVPVVSNHACEQQMRRTRLGPSFNLHPGFVCAGGEEGKDACKGDGGGPMVCERQGRWQLTGVVSWGIGCGQVGVPGVYARVSYYLDWIRQIVDY